MKNDTTDKIFKKQNFQKIKIIRAFIALGLAIVLWFYINGTTSDLILKEIRDIPVEIINEQQMNKKGLFIDEKSQWYISIRLRGKESNLRGINADKLTASIDVSEIKNEGDHELPIVIQGLPNSVILAEQIPEKISVSTDILENKEYSVEVIANGKPEANYKLNSTKTKEKVNITGSTTQLNRIASVSAKVNINGLNHDSQQYAIVSAYDKNGNLLDDLSIQPYKVFTEITLVRTH